MWDMSIPVPACCLSMYGESRVWKSLEHLQSLSHAFRWTLLCLVSLSQSHALAQIYFLPERWHSICQLQFFLPWARVTTPGASALHCDPESIAPDLYSAFCRCWVRKSPFCLFGLGLLKPHRLRCAHQVFSLEPPSSLGLALGIHVLGRVNWSLVFPCFKGVT